MPPTLQKNLSKSDFAELLYLSQESLTINDACALNKSLMALQDLVGCEHALCTHGNIVSALSHSAPEVEMLNVSYPDDYLANYLDNGHHLTDAVLKEFIATEVPINWQQVDQKYGINYPAATSALDFGMIDGWAHGIIAPKTMNCTAFFLGGSKSTKTIRSELIIAHTIPFLAEAYMRVLDQKKEPASPLTPKECEVLEWFKEGKSSWDTSMILNCSKRVVDFHAKNIMAKLEAVNRTHAVVKALEQRIINF